MKYGISAVAVKFVSFILLVVVTNIRVLSSDVEFMSDQL